MNNKNMISWLEEDSSKVQEWIAEQNAATRAYLDQQTERDALAKRLSELTHTLDRGVPMERNGKLFYAVREKNEELFKVVMQEQGESEYRVLIDPNTLSDDASITLASFRPNKDGSLLQYGLSHAGNDQVEIYILDVATGENKTDYIPSDIYPMFSDWDTDGAGFWYVRRDEDAPDTPDEAKFHKRIYYHTIGTSLEEDQYVFGRELDKEDWPFLSVSEDGMYLLIGVQVMSTKKRRADYYLIDRSDETSKKARLIYGGIDARPEGVMHRGEIYFNTDEGAPKGKLVKAQINNIPDTPKKWSTVIPEGDDQLLTFALQRDTLYVEHLKNAYSVLNVYELNGTKRTNIELPTYCSVYSLRGEEESSTIYVGLTSYVIPPTVYKLKNGDDDLEELWSTEVDFDFSTLEVTQKWFQSKDGTEVSLFIVHRTDIELDGKRPTLVWGYGGFGSSLQPLYTRHALPLLDAGGVYVEVNLRGGGEYGEEWHEAGRRKNKQNVFDDMICAVKHLIKSGYTSKDKVAIFGWSNGGLLTSALVTQQPDLFKAAVIGTPVTDMLRFHLFHGGRHWISEYGNPDVEADATFLKAYSPYHNITQQAYPSALVVTADQDDRVHPSHSYKFTARLQENNTANTPVLLRVESKAGHAGAAARSKGVDRFADILAFIFHELDTSFREKSK